VLLVNTGWTGGAYAPGKPHADQGPRALLTAALKDQLAGVEYAKNPKLRL